MGTWRAPLCLLAALLLAATSEALLPRPDTPVLRIVDRARGGDALVRVDPVKLERAWPPLGASK